MTHYAGKHRAARKVGPTRRAGTGIAAAATLGVSGALAATTLTAAPAMAQAPPVSSDSASTESTSTASTDSQATQSAPAESASSSSGLVQLGDSGDAVRSVQQQVGVTADGVFGPETAAAVKDFQSGQGLAVDGIVGPETRAALAGGSSAGASDSDASATSADAAATSDETASGNGGDATVSSDSGGSDISVSTVSADSGDAAGSSAASSSAGGVLGTAAALVGTPYAHGGDSPSTGFDCSGFTQHVFAQNGIDIPRMTGAQQAAATPVSNPQPGDLVFFGSPAYHVGIYAGDGMMYDAGNPGTDTTKRAIWTDNVSYGRL